MNALRKMRVLHSLLILQGCRSLTIVPPINTGTRTRGSHSTFFEQRDWKSVETFWRMVVSIGQLPPAMSLNPSYSDTSCGLSQIEQIGYEGEFASKDPRYIHRKTYALRIGYVGTEYSGYQRQQSLQQGLSTVEQELSTLMHWRPICAGRTDKDVSALSQVLSFTTTSDLDTAALVQSLAASAAVQQGRLAAYECVRVPRKFNSRSQAIWRRYVFLFPLQATGGGYDIDCEFVHEVLHCLEGQTLPCSALAYREERRPGDDGEPLDKCTILSARASVVRLPGSDAHALCMEIVGDRFLRRMVRIVVATAVRESLLPLDERDKGILERICVTGDSSLAAWPCSGVGLALCGVGYDFKELAMHQHMTAATRKHFETKFGV